VGYWRESIHSFLPSPSRYLAAYGLRNGLPALESADYDDRYLHRFERWIIDDVSSSDLPRYGWKHFVWSTHSVISLLSKLLLP
jgi:hypothetical protein